MFFLLKRIKIQDVRLRIIFEAKWDSYQWIEMQVLFSTHVIRFLTSYRW